MTRLTKQLRETILNNILKATKYPQLEEEYKKKFYVQGTAYAKSFLPKDFEAKTKGVPREWLATCTYIGVRGMEDPRYITSSPYSYSIEVEAFAVPVGFSVPPIRGEDMPDWIAKLAKETSALKADYRQLRTKLDASLRSYNSVAKLLKDFPEFERHIPSQSINYPVSTNVSEVSTLLMASGFDTGVEKKTESKKVTIRKATRAKK